MDVYELAQIFGFKNERTNRLEIWSLDLTSSEANELLQAGWDYVSSACLDNCKWVAPEHFYSEVM